MPYLDHNATTPVAPEVLAAMEPFWRGHFANPSSGSLAAKPVRKAVEKAREECAALLDCDPAELVFTSGGTESLNTALHSLTAAQPGKKHLITGSTEHEAVMNPLAWLESAQGYEITRLPVDCQGLVSLTDLAAAIRPGVTAGILLMWANNETGVLHPIPEAAALAAAHGIPLVTDAVQAAGKIPLSLRESGVQYAAFSGHKFHAPKGIGLLYVRQHTPFVPLLLGGSQENHRRAGTENTAAIVGLGEAARLNRLALEHETASASALAAAASLAADAVETGSSQNLAQPEAILSSQGNTSLTSAGMGALRDEFERTILERIPGSHRNGHPAKRVPNTTSLRFDGTQAEGLLMLLDQRGITASAGSACTTGSLHPSHVLTAMGLDAPAARSTLRFSLARSTTRQELQQTLTALEAAVTKFRTLMPVLS